MATGQLAREQSLVLFDVPWTQYLHLLRDLEGHRVRLTYNRGVLEFMTLSHEHENESYILGRMVDVMTEELNLPVKGGRSTTFKRRKYAKGLEPDCCWWIQNELKVRFKKVIDLRIDPAPDLALEVDISHSSMDRMRIYAILGFPEIWQYDGKTLMFHILQANRKYQTREESLAFPGLKAADLLAFLALHDQVDETAFIRQFRAWVRQQFGLQQP
jgi:Uma2 family endonuclease